MNKMVENLQLGESYESLRDDKHLTYVSQMPLAVGRGYRPINTVEVLENRFFTSEEVQRIWQFNSFYTVDGCSTHPDGSFKVVPDCELLMAVNPQTVLVEIDSAIPLEIQVYESLQGTSFSKEQRNEYTGRDQTEKQARTNPVLLALARGNQDLLDQSVKVSFKYLKDMCGSDKGMKVYISNAPFKLPELRAWCVGEFDNHPFNNTSSALGNGRLDNRYARLVRVRARGMAEQVQRNDASEKVVVASSLEQVLDVAKPFNSEFSIDKLK